MIQLLGISGHKHSGKSEIAKQLTAQGYTILKFADALKDMVCEIVGCTREELEERKEEPLHIYIDYYAFATIVNRTGFDKEKLAPLLRGRTFHSIRHLLQFLGTDVIRKFDENWHVKKLQEKLVPGGMYAVDDMRFHNEVAFIEGEGGVTLRINRPGTGKDAHESETALDDYAFDYVIQNDSTLSALESNVRALLAKLMENENVPVI